MTPARTTVFQHRPYLANRPDIIAARPPPQILLQLSNPPRNIPPRDTPYSPSSAERDIRFPLFPIRIRRPWLDSLAVVHFQPRTCSRAMQYELLFYPGRAYPAPARSGEPTRNKRGIGAATCAADTSRCCLRHRRCPYCATCCNHSRRLSHVAAHLHSARPAELENSDARIVNTPEKHASVTIQCATNGNDQYAPAATLVLAI